MKVFNHKQALGLMYKTTQLSIDPQDRGMDMRRLQQVIEILQDCDCESCQKIYPGLIFAQRCAERGDYQASGIALSITSEKLGLLSLPPLHAGSN